MSRNLRGRRRWRDLTPRQKTALTVSAAVQFGLAAAAWTDLARRPPAQVRGPKWRWAALIAINYAGPIIYFRWGRRRPPATSS
jgi:Phospholipase_D-nuclease N-terminal